MPTYYVEDIDIDPGDFVDSCNRQEIEELVKTLIEDGHISRTAIKQVGSQEENTLDITYREALDKLYYKRIYLTLEEEQSIINLANKY
jgi:anaerobic ribonucleoside-triphosphate reductase